MNGSPRAVVVGGRGVKLAPSSGVVEPELFVCLDVDAAGPDALVRLASGVERSWLTPDRLDTRIEVVFDDRGEKLIARKSIRFDDLVVEELPAHMKRLISDLKVGQCCLETGDGLLRDLRPGHVQPVEFLQVLQLGQPGVSHRGPSQFQPSESLQVTKVP